MRDKLAFIRLPLLIVVLFFVGRLVLGAAGVSYDTANRVFSMVILQTHIALLWSGAGRAFKHYGLKDSVISVAMIILFSQLLILLATAGSYLTGADTYFNYPEALNSDTPVEFMPAMMARVGGLVANTLFGSIIACLGWLLGGLVPAARRAQPEGTRL